MHKPLYDGKSRTCVLSQQVSKTLGTWGEGWKEKFICSDKPDWQALNLNTWKFLAGCIAKNRVRANHTPSICQGILSLHDHVH